MQAAGAGRSGGRAGGKKAGEFSTSLWKTPPPCFMGCGQPGQNRSTANTAAPAARAAARPGAESSKIMVWAASMPKWAMAAR